MFKSVIWATDGSESADAALAYARCLVAESKGTLFVVHVEEHFHGGRVGGYPVFADEAEIEAKIQAQVHELREAGLAVHLEVIEGRAGQAAHLVAELAREHAADAIVVGSRGLGPVAGLFVGSVTQRLLHTTPCPVLVVPASTETEGVPERATAGAAARS
jgi:nucleotide-binding universal stress UspA family protein